MSTPAEPARCPHCCRVLNVKVYVASRYEDRADALALKAFLEANDFVVVADWLLPQDDNQPMASIKGNTKLCAEIGDRAVENIDNTDVTVVMSPAKAHGTGTGGRHVELGIAIGLGKGTVLYGERENVFHHREETLLCAEQRMLPSVIHAAFAAARTRNLILRAGV